MSTRKVIRSVRTASAVVYILNMAVCIHYMIKPQYLPILIGSTCTIISLIMLIISTAQPKFLVDLLDKPRFASLFTFRGRYLADLYVALYLYAMGIFGSIMGTITIGFILGIRFVGVRNPEAFNALFRPSADAVDDDRTVYTDGDTATYDDYGRR